MLKHGHSTKKFGTTAEYRIWKKIKSRCFNKNIDAFKNYGGRGITVCERWMEFSAFFEDMGARPSSKHTIDRIEVNGDYEPGNCRWATMKEQNRNRTNNRIESYGGVTASLAELCELNGVAYKTVFQRLSMGASIDLSMTKGRMPYRSIEGAKTIEALNA